MANEMPRADIALLALSVLDRAPAHGYAIAREIDRRCDGRIVLHDGALYPALRLLEESGAIASEWIAPDSGNGPKRRVYEITDGGRRELAARADAFRAYARDVESLLANVPNPTGGSLEPAS